jgi:uncharacterized protein
MGGRIASMVADDLEAAGKIVGVLCLGYPFHPPGKPAQLRAKHLADLKTPALICQGTRDVFGTREEVSSYVLSDRIEVLWLDDGDHDLKPRKTVSGATFDDHLRTLALAVSAWVDRILRCPREACDVRVRATYSASNLPPCLEIKDWNIERLRYLSENPSTCTSRTL